MARADQIVRVPLHVGLDLYSDPKQAKGLLLSENVQSTHGGQVRTRKGFTAFSASTEVQDTYREATAVLDAAQGLIPWDGQPLIVGADRYTRTVGGVANVGDLKSGGGIFGPVSSGAASKWAVLGESEHFDVEVRSGPMPDTSTTYKAVGYAQSGEYEIFVYRPWAAVTDGMLYSIRNTSTGAWIFHSGGAEFGGTTLDNLYTFVLTVDATATPADGERFMLVSATTSALYYVSIVPATGAATVYTLTDACREAAFGMFDVVPCYDGSTKAALIACKSPAQSKVRLAKVRGNGVIRSSYTALASAGTNLLAVAAETTVNFIGLLVADRTAGTGVVYAYPSAFTGDPVAASATSAALFPSITFGDAADSVAVNLVFDHHTYLDTGRETGAYSWAAFWSCRGYATDADRTQPLVYGVDGTYDGASTLACVDVNGTVTRGVFITAKPFVYNKRIYIPAVTQTIVTTPVTQVSYNYHTRLLLLTPRIPVPASSGMALHVVGHLVSSAVVAQYQSGTTGLPPITPVVGTAAYVSAVVQVRTTVGSESAWMTITSGVPTAVVLDFAPTNPPQYIVSGKDLIIGGPVIRQVDGNAQELGFFQPAEIFDVAASGGAGLLSAGDYNYSAIWEWVDKFGQVHRSRPALTYPKTGFSLNDAGRVNLADPGLLAFGGAGIQSGRKAPSTYAVLWRTDVGAGNGGMHHRLTTNDGRGVQVGTATSANGYQFVIDDDQDSDANLDATELLYTNGGVIGNSPPPGSNILLAHKRRVFLVPYESPTRIWFSKERVAGVGLSFSDELILDLPDGGAIKGLAALDDYVAVFHAARIEAFGGDGPNSLGAGGFSLPQTISRDIGCRDSNSVVSFLGGIVFKSNKGFMLLDRSLQIRPIGLPVSDYDADICIRAVHMPESRELHFLHASTLNYTLVYDYVNDAWRTWVAAAAMAEPIDIANVDGTLMMLCANATNVGVFKATLDTLTDIGEGFAFQLSTPWVHLEGMQDFQRVRELRIIGDWPATGHLTVALYYDYAAASSQSVTVDLANVATDDIIRIKPQIGRCKAIRATLTNGNAWPTTGRLSELALQIATKPGKMARVKSTATY